MWRRGPERSKKCFSGLQTQSFPNLIYWSLSINFIFLFISWIHTSGSLATFLPMFIFLQYLFICLNISINILIIIKKGSKIRTWFAFWLNTNEIQPSKILEWIAILFYWILSILFEFHFLRRVWSRFVKFTVCICYFVFSLFYRVLIVLVGF